MQAMQDLATHLSDRHFRRIAELVDDHIGIKLPAAKRIMLEGRLQKRVRELHCLDINDYVDRLLDDEHFESELIHLIDCVTTNKTDFFREPSHFTFLREVAVPEMLQRRGRNNRPLKLWSAACSTGMEAYTIAIVLDDMIYSGANFQFSVLGTDISTGVLGLAELPDCLAAAGGGAANACTAIAKAARFCGSFIISISVAASGALSAGGPAAAHRTPGNITKPRNRKMAVRVARMVISLDHAGG